MNQAASVFPHQDSRHDAIVEYALELGDKINPFILTLLLPKYFIAAKGN